MADLANGNICVAAGFSGDVLQAADRAEENGSGIEIAYAIPKEGSTKFLDNFAIPASAQNKELAHQFINFLLQHHDAA